MAVSRTHLCCASGVGNSHCIHSCEVLHGFMDRCFAARKKIYYTTKFSRRLHLPWHPIDFLRIKYSNSTLGDEILTWYDEVKIDPVKKLIVRKARLDIVNLPAKEEWEDARADLQCLNVANASARYGLNASSSLFKDLIFLKIMNQNSFTPTPLGSSMHPEGFGYTNRPQCEIFTFLVFSWSDIWVHVWGDGFVHSRNACAHAGPPKPRSSGCDSR